MFAIRLYSKYVTDGINVFSSDRLYPVTPRIHPVKGFKQYFLRQDDGDVFFVSQRDIEMLTIKPKTLARTNTRGKTVTHSPTGQVFKTIKDAVTAHGISVAKLKSSNDYVID